MKLFMRSVGIVFFSLLFLPCSDAHRPVFSQRAQTIWKGGIMQEARFYHAKFHFHDLADAIKNQEITMLVHESWYGITPHLTFQLDSPLIISKRDGAIKTSGFGNAEAFLKYRFFKKDSVGKSLQCSLIGGVRLPTADQVGRPVPGFFTMQHDHSNIAFLPSLAGVYESRCLYLYATLGADFPVRKNNTRQGNALVYSAAYLYRPKPLQAGQLDWAFGSELNGYAQEKDTLDNKKNRYSGGQVIFAGPVFGLAYKNLFLRGGFQTPMIKSNYGTDRRAWFRTMLIFSAEF